MSTVSNIRRLPLLTRPSLSHLIALIALLALIVGCTLVAPEEATLGANMRWVYLHVSFTWAGTSLLNTAGLAGIYLLVRPTMQLSRWIAPAQTAGLVLFSVGFILSLVASWTSWGGILWMEPRVLSSVAILAGGCAIVLAVRSMISPRVIGIAAIVLSVGVSILLGSTGRVFHPDDPIDASDSSVIQMTFYGLTVLAIAFGVLLTIIAKATSNPKPRVTT